MGEHPSQPCLQRLRLHQPTTSLTVMMSCSDLNLEFEIPFRELGFHGVPARSTSFIMPTVNCLVELTEMPFTVITLAGEALCMLFCWSQAAPQKC